MGYGRSDKTAGLHQLMDGGPARTVNGDCASECLMRESTDGCRGPGYSLDHGAAPTHCGNGMVWRSAP